MSVTAVMRVLLERVHSSRDNNFSYRSHYDSVHADVTVGVERLPAGELGKLADSWGTGMLTPLPSFPRKRESSDLKGFCPRALAVRSVAGVTRGPPRPEASPRAGQRPEPRAAAGMTVLYSEATFCRPLYG